MRRIKVLVVEDSIVMRRAITTALAKDPGIEVVGEAVNGRVALEMLPKTKPDLITLDIEMPELDGLATLREIRKTNLHLPVIMFSSLTQRGARATIVALTLGATDFVGKPAGYGMKVREEYTANDYHKPSDDIKPGWELSGAVQDLKLFLTMGYRVANASKSPEWRPGNEFRAIRERQLKP